MNDILSQADLDALAGDIESPSSEQPVETPDMDKLFSDLMALQAQAPAETSDPGGGQSSDSENLSQDQIDELLKEFLE